MSNRDIPDTADSHNHAGFGLLSGIRMGGTGLEPVTPSRACLIVARVSHLPTPDELRAMSLERTTAANQPSKEEARANEALRLLRLEYASIISEYAVRAQQIGVRRVQLTWGGAGICHAAGYPLGVRGVEIVAVPPSTYRVRHSRGSVARWLYGTETGSPGRGQREEELPVTELTVFGHRFSGYDTPIDLWKRSLSDADLKVSAKARRGARGSQRSQGFDARHLRLVLPSCSS